MSTVTDTTLQVHSSFDQDVLYELHVEHNGYEAEKATLVFLHGYLGSPDDYNYFKENYQDDYNIILYALKVMEAQRALMI